MTYRFWLSEEGLDVLVPMMLAEGAGVDLKKLITNSTYFGVIFGSFLAGISRYK